MAVVQEQKQKVRLVLDCRKLNGFVDAFTANAEVCAQKLREWRRQGVNVSLLDLRNARRQGAMPISNSHFQGSALV